MDETGRSYDRVAERYAVEIGNELAGKPLDRQLLATVFELSGGGLVADLGAGPGHVAAYLQGLGARVIASDLSPQMCRVAAARGLPAVAGDLTRLPFRDGSLAAVVCFYAVIHLDEHGRRSAYAELARALMPGGHALIAFHVRDVDVPAGGAVTRAEWWGEVVDLTFRFLDPDGEVRLLAEAGLGSVARMDRQAHPEVEHPSERCYLLVQSWAAERR